MHFAQYRESNRVQNRATLLHALLEPGPTWNDLFEITWKYGGRVRKTR